MVVNNPAICSRLLDKPRIHKRICGCLKGGARMHITNCNARQGCDTQSGAHLLAVKTLLLAQLLRQRLVLHVVEHELRVRHQRVPRLLWAQRLKQSNGNVEGDGCRAEEQGCVMQNETAASAQYISCTHKGR